MLKTSNAEQLSARQPVRAEIEKFVLAWEQPRRAAMIALLIYALISMIGRGPFGLSDTPYFNYLADAFLHGQLHLRLVPPVTIDLSLFQDQYYLYWGPLPAVIAMPLVAVFGVEISDIFQALVVSAMVVGILAAVLRAADARDVIELSPFRRGLLVLFFALGTPFFPITGTGQVWMLVQLECLLFVFLAFLAAFTCFGWKAFFLTGSAMAGVLATRMSAVFVGVFLAWYLYKCHWRLGFRRLSLYSFIAILPVIAMAGLLLLYNHLRFGSPFDNGLYYHQLSEFFRDDFLTYGVFDVHFIPANFYYTYMYYPFSLIPVDYKIKCGSLFLMSPLFFVVLVTLWKYRQSAMTWVLWFSILLGNIPLLLLMGPGSALVGPRYILDFVMPLLLLTAIGMKHLPDRMSVVLASISILHYLIATVIYTVVIT